MLKALPLYTHSTAGGKNNKGITLVALVTTIIICLILFSVAIQMIRKSNLEYVAKSASSKMNAAKVQESEIGNGNMIEQYVLQSMCTHEWGAWSITTGATETEKGTKERTCTKCGKVEIGETELIIGANINYHEYIGEDGTALSTMPSYTSPQPHTGNTGGDQKFTVSNNSGIQWIVLGEENGQIKITTKNILYQDNRRIYGIAILAIWTSRIQIFCRRTTRNMRNIWERKICRYK